MRENPVNMREFKYQVTKAEERVGGLMNEIEFRDRKSYPGLEGGPFEVLIRAGELIDQIPSIVFASILFALAAIINLGHWQEVVILYIFFLGDWVLMALLPVARISFGPSKSPVLMLAFLR